MKSLMRPGIGMPFVVDHAQRRVAVLHRIGDDAQREQIVHLIERDLLPLHLLIHRVRPLDARLHARRECFRGADSPPRHAASWSRIFFVLLRAAIRSRASARPTPPVPGSGTRDLPARRGFCPSRGDARWARKSRPSPARCATGARAAAPPSVRMLCSRSASFTMMTRMSFTIASSILRTLSACRSSRE